MTRSFKDVLDLLAPAQGEHAHRGVHAFDQSRGHGAPAARHLCLTGSADGWRDSTAPAIRVIVHAPDRRRGRQAENEPLGAAIHDYEERARRYWPLHVFEVKDEPVRPRIRTSSRRREGERLATSSVDAQVVACEVGGRTSVVARVRDLGPAAARGGGDVAFVIGGAHGLADDLTERALRASRFSSWTLPHELARLGLAEQLYRAGTIVRGEPYHK
jgi:23S rRNA (pseudouridine1915-N3)-methyltransferase